MLDRRVFVSSVNDLLEAHGAQLQMLRGKPLQASWVAWDLQEDAWFQDEAVILRIGSDNLEIVCQKFDEIALTWNTIDVSASALMYPWDDRYERNWRQDALPVLRQAIGSTVEGLAIIECRPQITILHDERRPDNVGKVYEPWLLHGLEFTLGQHHLLVFNALDENGIMAEAPTGPEFRRVAVW